MTLQSWTPSHGSRSATKIWHSEPELPLLTVQEFVNDERPADVEHPEDHSEICYNSKNRDLEDQPVSRSSHKDVLRNSVRTDSITWDTREYSKLADGDGSTDPTRGWKTAVVASAYVTGFVLALNITFSLVAMVKFKVHNGIGTIYEGNCERVQNWDVIIHLIINILGTVLLSASSFTMQCITSPTRAEVDRAHSKRISLDIGLASCRNLFYMRPRKVIMWIGLCLSTLPLHVLWNSTVFSSNSNTNFSYLVVSQDFLTGATHAMPNSSSLTACLDERFSQDTVSMILTSYLEGHYTHLNAHDCLNAYTAAPLTDRRNLIIVTEPTADMNMGGCGFDFRKWNGSSLLALQTNIDWNLDWSWTLPPWVTGSLQTDEQVEQSIEFNGTWTIGSNISDVIGHTPRYPVEYCLSETVGVSKCQLQFVPYILYVVIFCNLIKVICMSFVAFYFWDLDNPILATVGDATASFLDRPDNTTTEWCLMDRKDLKSWRAGKGASMKESRYTRTMMTRLYHATSRTRWWSTVALCVFYLIVGFVLFYLSLLLDDGYVGDLSEQLSLSFGPTYKTKLLYVGNNSIDTTTGANLVLDIFIANSFQLVLSTTYFPYNSLYTAQCAALEWTSYVQGEAKSLRVSYPRGQQRSTNYLHLPYRYAIPLTIVLVAMHFLVSQSVFLARLQFYNSDGSPTGAGYSDVGCSPGAIFITCWVGFVMVAALVLHSCRKLDNRIPIHGNSSAVISALCHAEQQHGDLTVQRQLHSDEIDQERNDENISLKPLTWGVTIWPNDNMSSIVDYSDQFTDLAGHCTFGNKILELPKLGSLYR